MAFEFKLPDIGEGVVEGEIVTWHFAEGDAVQEDDPLVEVMTDKATVTIPSPRTGTIDRIFFQEGDIAPVGDLLVRIATVGEAPAPSASAQREQSKPAVAPAVREAKESTSGTGTGTGRVLAAPATRKRARELGVDIQQLAGSGPGGRITLTDVERAGAGTSPQPPAVTGVQAPLSPRPQPVTTPSRPTPALEKAASAVAVRPGESKVVPIRGLRKKIFEKMAQSKRTASHFTYVEEVDMTRLVETRSRLRARAEKNGVKLTFLPFVMKAVSLGLMDFPEVNATIDDEKMELTQYSSYNLSVAVATDGGLTVPVIHSVESRSIFELAKALEDLSERARAGKLQRAELQGGTFTITSLGTLGGMFATPILNYPEVGILGIHKIEDRPVVIDGEIQIRKRMYLSSSFDHRVIDGHVGAAFVQRIKDLLEDPAALLLELR